MEELQEYWRISDCLEKKCSLILSQVVSFESIFYIFFFFAFLSIVESQVGFLFDWKLYSEDSLAILWLIWLWIVYVDVGIYWKFKCAKRTRCVQREKMYKILKIYSVLYRVSNDIWNIQNVQRSLLNIRYF